jgi:hypothetical protein
MSFALADRSPSGSGGRGYGEGQGLDCGFRPERVVAATGWALYKERATAEGKMPGLPANVCLVQDLKLVVLVEETSDLSEPAEGCRQPMDGLVMVEPRGSNWTFRGASCRLEPLP